MDAAIESTETFVIDAVGERRMVIRPTTIDDAERLQSLYGSLDPDDLSKRFFTAWKPRIEWCRSWASVGERGGFGLIVVIEQPSGEVVAGEAGYALRPDGDGDLAVTVAREWRGWLGAYLLDRLVQHAAAAGVTNLQADVLLDNTPMLRVLRHRGAVAFGHPDGTEHCTISTVGYVPSWPPNERRRRILVEVPGGRWSGETAAATADLAVAMCAGPARRTRHECPLLVGGHCPLADGADAIVVLLDPDDQVTERLIDGHAREHPHTPLYVRRAPVPAGDDAGDVEHHCHLLTGDTRIDLAAIAESIDVPDS